MLRAPRQAVVGTNTLQVRTGRDATGSDDRWDGCVQLGIYANLRDTQVSDGQPRFEFEIRRRSVSG